MQAPPLDYLDDIKRIAYEAGQAILNVYNHGYYCVEQKPDDSPVTAADMASHDVIKQGLAELTPLLPLLSEEDVFPSFAERQQWSQYWLVDPLDGTREFIRGSGEFTVNIALIDRNLPVLGVIYAPVSGECYWAVKNGGAYKSVGAEKDKISTRAWNEEHLVIAGSRSRHTPVLDKFKAQFSDHSVLKLGSSLKSCYVAEGRADVYMRYGPTAEWDTAAAQIIVEEAGGALVNAKGQPLTYNTKDSIINPSFITYGDRSQDWLARLPDVFHKPHS